MNLVSPFDPVMALMFYKPGSYQPDNIAKKINKVLEGNIVKKPGELYIMTTVDEFNMWNGFIRWKMSKERVKMMKAEGWAMAPYRFDIEEAGKCIVLLSDTILMFLNRCIAAQPIPARKWSGITIT